MPAHPPLVSVVIPAYNAAAHLRETLDCVLAQTCSALEVIVVDDGSTDETPVIAEAAVASDPRVSLVRRSNGGVGAARNTGLRVARGRYIAPLDADDLWSPRKLELQVARLEHAGPKAGLAYCWSRNIDQQNRVISWAHPYRIEGRAGSSMLLGNFIGNASVPLFRASALAEVGGYLTREEQHGEQGCEDWDLNIRVAEKFRICCAADYLVSYRQCETSMSTNARGMAISYETAMERAHTRNPGLPPSFLAWSTSRFYSYLVSKCYSWSDYRGTLHYLGKVLRADPVSLLNPRTYRIGTLALAHLLSGGRLRRHPSPPAITRGSDPFFKEPPPFNAPHEGVFGRIQKRRLEIALKIPACRKPRTVEMSDAFGY